MIAVNGFSDLNTLEKKGGDRMLIDAEQSGKNPVEQKDQFIYGITKGLFKIVEKILPPSPKIDEQEVIEFSFTDDQIVFLDITKVGVADEIAGNSIVRCFFENLIIKAPIIFIVENQIKINITQGRVMKDGIFKSIN